MRTVGLTFKKAAKADDKPADAPKALSKMNRDELDAIVVAEGVDIGDATTNAAIVVKIAEHRAKADDKPAE